MAESPTPADVMLEATRASLRTGRVMSAAVIRHQLDALAAAGYVIQPRFYDDGAAVLLKAARRAFRGGHFSPSVVVEQQIAAVEQEGRAFVQSGEDRRSACDAFEWGPASFEACSRCAWSYWKHAESAGRRKGAHRGG
ncbi:MAG: hypothetical protein DLM59_01665 [Pseudonocardiales bacterium]|nr:MAG: hypothetical protein DLM59_01665 [Pseudonocardiales bacterium]